jgi:hypothetical protein
VPADRTLGNGQLHGGLERGFFFRFLLHAQLEFGAGILGARTLGSHCSHAASHAQMAGLGEGDGVFHGIAVADFADQNHGA